MKLNSDYQLIKRENQNLLANLENGDLYEINDVVVSIFDLCAQYESIEKLAEAIYNMYPSKDSYSCKQLMEFIHNLVSEGFLED